MCSSFKAETKNLLSTSPPDDDILDRFKNVVPTVSLLVKRSLEENEAKNIYRERVKYHTAYREATPLRSVDCMK